MNLKETAYRLGEALPIGAGAGPALLALDLLCARLTLGYGTPVGLRFLGVYVVAGMATAVLLRIVGNGIGRRADAVRLGAWTTAFLCVPALVERLDHVLSPGPGKLVPTLLVPASAGIVALGVEAVGRILGPDRDAWAGFLVAAAASAGLAINRNVVASPLEPAALGLDAAVLGSTLLIALAVRKLRGPRAWGAVAGLGILAFGLVHAIRRDPPRSAPDPDRPPSLVLVVIDTLRQDVFQDVVRSSPEGRAFARAWDGAAWFEEAVAAAPWTAPSMGSIMTGLYPREHGLVKPSQRRDLAAFTRLSDEIPTLAEKLGRRGYQTAAIVANPILHPQSGISRGFEHYEVLAGPTVKLPLLTALSRAGLLQREFYQQARWVRKRFEHELERIDRGRPLFLWLHFMDPHDPLYEQNVEPEPGDDALPEADRLYRHEVRYTLAELTAVVEASKEHGLWNDAAWILVSDHGEMFPSDDRGAPGRPKLRKLQGHGHALYDELARVPLVIRPPGGLPAPRRVRALVHHTDLHDTIGDLLGADFRRIGRDRVSLLPWLEATPPIAPPARELALIEATHSGPEQRALRTRRFKLIDYFQKPGPPELYELTRDPDESRDLAPERPGQAETLRRRLTEFWKGLEDPPMTEAQELDDETRRQLEALGYL